MLEIIMMKILGFRDREPRKFELITVISALVVSYTIYKAYQKIKSDNPRQNVNKIEAILDTDQIPDAPQGVMDINKLDKGERMKAFQLYEQLIMPDGEIKLGLHYINIPGVSIMPLANIRGTVTRSRLKNESNSKSITVMVDAFGIYDEKRKGSPYYYILDDTTGEPHHIPFDKEQLYAFIKVKLGININNNIRKEVPELDETKAVANEIPDRSLLDEFLISQNKKRSENSSTKLNSIRGISKTTSEKLRSIGILFIEDIADLPNDAITTVSKLLGKGYWEGTVKNWRKAAIVLQEA